MLGALAALSLLPALHLPHVAVQNPFHAFRPAQHGEVRTTFTRLPDGWRLSKVSDSFTGVGSCRLDGHGVRLSAGLATFSFGGKVDTANAVWRLDGGPLRSIGEVGPEVAGMGVNLISNNTWNPSDGRVRIPWTRLAGAERLDIRANPGRDHRSFALSSLRGAVDAARGYGCTDFA